MNKTVGLLALAIAALSLTQCKKEDKQPIPPTTAKENTLTAKDWLAQQQAALIKSGGAMQFDAAAKINWNNPINGTDGSTQFIPIATNNKQLGRYLKLTKAANGAITGGNYVYLYPIMQQEVNAYLLEGKKIPADFSGTLLEYGLDNQLLVTKVYEKGSTVAGKTTKLALKPAPNSLGGNTAAARTVCTAYYIETYMDGVMVSEIYLYTICVKEPDEALITDDGSGGGGAVDETAALMAQFNDHVKSATPVPASVTAPTTTPDPEPVSYTHKWVVAEGAIVNWHVYALTQMDYYHNKFYDMQTNSIEHRYNVIFYKTIDSYYEGPNFATTTTWTNSSPNSPIDNVFNNNTGAAVGTSKVFGKLKHRANFTLPPVFGLPPVTPEREESAGNSLRMEPK